MAKFDTVTDNKGKTRRERGANVRGYKAPSASIPDSFDYIVGWFYELRSFCEDSTKPLMPRDIMAWADCVGCLLSRWERDTLFSMDRVFRRAVSEELAHNEEREKAKK